MNPWTSPQDIQNQLQSFGSNICLIAGDKSYTFQDIDETSAKLADSLYQKGVSMGDILGIYGFSPEETYFILFALWKLEASPLPLNHYWPLDKVQKHIHQLSASFLLHKKTPTLFDSSHTFSYSLERISDNSLNNKNISNLLFTSSSTGKPKGVCHTFSNHFYSAMGSYQNIPFHQGHRWALTLPLYHVGGLSLIFRSLLKGGTLVIPKGKEKPGNPSFSQFLNKNKITHLSFVPTQLKRFMLNLNILPSSISAILVGGAPIPKRLIIEGLKKGLPLYPTYGMTEMASQICTAPKETPLQFLCQTLGKTLPFREVKIAEDGEILVKGKVLFPFYLTELGLQKPALQKGWYPTRDLGTLTEEGYLIWKGRKDNLFISGGENIHPEEIEKTLLDFDEIEEAIVLPQKDPEYGQVPIAFIRCSSSLSYSEMEKKLALHLPTFMIPRKFYPFPKDFPKGLKINRKELIKWWEKNSPLERSR